MSEDSTKQFGSPQPVHRGNLFLCGISLFFLGVSVGVMAGTFGMKFLRKDFHPDPRNMTEMILQRITADFSLTEQQESSIRKRLDSFHEEISQEVQQAFKKLDTKKARLIEQMSEEFTDPSQKQRWLDTGKRYFPGPPDGGGPGGPGGPSPDGPGRPGDGGFVP